MLSFWEKESLLQYDTIIIGAGLVGLSTALGVKDRAPNNRVLVLERAVLPTGASTKNAGFACTGSLTEIIDDLNNMPEADLLALVELRQKGLQRLRKRLGDTNIGYAENGSWELISNNPDELSSLDRIAEINTKLKTVLGPVAFQAYSYDNHKEQFGFNEKHVKYIVKNYYEGELNSGMMMRNLIDLCISRGIEIKTGCPVENIHETPTGAEVVVAHHYLKTAISFKASQVGVCTNAFTSQLFPGLDLKPGRGQVLVTKPIDNLPFKGIYHFDKGYYYFRRLGNRVLFGGGRNLDFEGEQTTEFAFNNNIHAELLHKLETVILPGTRFEIADWWTGIMAFGSTKFPVVKRHSAHISLGVRMGGMGVAMGSEIGEQLADLMLAD